MIDLRLVRLAILAICMLSGPLNEAHAGLVIYHGDFSVHFKSTGIGDEVQLGDTYYWQLDIDESAFDTDPSLTRGSYDNVFLNVRFVPAATNAGSWNPIPSPLPNDGNLTNTFPPGGLFNVINIIDASGPPITFYGNPVSHFQMSNYYQADISDSGAGQTWAEQVTNLRRYDVMDVNYGNNPIDGSPEIVRLAGANFGFGSNPNIVAVPEPSSYLLMSSVLAVLATKRRLRHRKSMLSVSQ